MIDKPAKQKFWFVLLIFGDILSMIVVTLGGFATHGTLGSAGWRMLTTFIPLLAAWCMTAPFLGAYHLRNASQWRQLWRPLWSVLLAAPLAGLIRGLWLDQLIVPVFILILGGVSALAILVWRLIYLALFSRAGKSIG